METIFWIIAALLCAGLLVVKYRKYNVHRALQMPKNPPYYPDSAIQSAKEIGRFLSDRADAAGLYYISSTEKTGMESKDLRRISEGKEWGVINLIRMAHYLGCEVVIRQTGTQDTEDPATTPQVFAEYITEIKEERYSKMII